MPVKIKKKVAEIVKVVHEKTNFKDAGGRPTGKVKLTKWDWKEVLETLVQSHLQKKPITLPKLAEKFGISYPVVRNKSSKHNWFAEVEKRLKEIDDVVATKIQERSTMVMDKLQEEFVGNEVEIRIRHAKIARGLQAKAVKRLSTIAIDQLSPRDAIALLKLGIDEERRALGMPSDYVAPPQDNVHPEYRSVKEQMGNHQRIQLMSAQIVKALGDASKKMTTEENPLSAVGLEDLTENDAERDITSEGKQL